MSAATSGDTVKFHYTGRLDDGQEFDSSRGQDPMEVTLGTGTIIPGLESALMGMAPGGKRTVTIDPDQAYGHRDDRLVYKVERDRIPNSDQLEVGAILQAQIPESPMPLRLEVTEVEAGSVTLDANHPLAGQELTFDVEIVDISSGAKQ